MIRVIYRVPKNLFIFIYFFFGKPFWIKFTVFFLYANYDYATFCIGKRGISFFNSFAWKSTFSMFEFHALSFLIKHKGIKIILQ